MSFLRMTRQPALRSLTRSTNTPTLALTPRRLAHQDYGSGDGNPAGENPQAQGKNPSEKAEHPGPEPPTAGKKAGEKSQQQQQQGGGSQQPSSSSSNNNNKGTQDASSPQPRILNDPPPPASGSQGAPGEVEQHNREMDQRAEKPHPKGRAEEDVEKDKVPKGFWAGQGGADRQP